MKKNVNVKEWVTMFEEVGLDEAKRDQWHRLFEARHADAHQGFLEWLGLSRDEIANIRAEFR